VKLFASATEAAIELLALFVATAGGNVEDGVAVAVVTVGNVVEKCEVVVWARTDLPPRELRRMASATIRFHAVFQILYVRKLLRDNNIHRPNKRVAVHFASRQRSAIRCR
jgi:hypothetical protein